MNAKRSRTSRLTIIACLSLVAASANACIAQDVPKSTIESPSAHHNPPDLTVVADATWQRIDLSVDRALTYLMASQRRNGSLPSMDIAEPAVTALYVMAAISAGHEPGIGQYGESLNRAIDYVLSVQKENGLFGLQMSNAPSPTRRHKPSQLSFYNLGICGMMLGEVYGMTDLERAARIKPAIEKSLAFLRQWQERPLTYFPNDRGGWRYYRLPDRSADASDLSVTSWQIMFLRSAHNAGFEVPEKWVAESMAYVRRCFDARTGGFRYANNNARQITRGVTGAGILCLFLSGQYDEDIERKSGAWLMRQSFTRFNTAPAHDRYIYAAYYCSQAAYQLGGQYWEKLYVPLAKTLIANQSENGSWAQCHHNGEYGRSYSTCMAILALTPPHQLLPIYQR